MVRATASLAPKFGPAQAGRLFANERTFAKKKTVHLAQSHRFPRLFSNVVCHRVAYIASKI